MDEKNTLLIHIGTPKTGTTALQKFLCNNRDNLIKVGWSYPKLKERFSYYTTTDPEITKNANLIFTECGKTLTDTEQIDTVWKAIRDELKYSNVILSSEEMYQYEVDSILESAKKEYGNIKVIVYLRRQDEYLESFWKHFIKMGICTENICTWYAKLCKEEWFRKTLHYYDKLKAIEKVVGKENIIVRIFEREQFQGVWGNIASDFLKSIGIEELDSFLPISRENEAYSKYVLELKRLLNSTYKEMDEDFQSINWYAMCNIMRIDENDSHIKESYLTWDERRQILEHFREENKKVAREYLGRDDGRLFCNEPKDMPQSTLDTGELCASAIKLLGNMVIKHQRLLERCKNAELAATRVLEMKVQMIAHDRELILFGAGERCRYLLNLLKIKVAGIVDNSERKQGDMLGGVYVSKPEMFIDREKYVMIVTCREYDEIKLQLHHYGLKEDVDYVLMSDYI